MSIYAKLAEIQKNLFVPKGQYNGFGKYAYRSCEDILKAVKPLCEENGCVLFITNDLVNIGTNNYVVAVVTLTDIETSEKITSTAHAREEESLKGMTGSQITGASSSYARKYALAGLFGIDNEQDSDATNKGDNEVTKNNTAVAGANNKAKALAYINKRNKAYAEGVIKHYNVKSLSDLTFEQAEDFIKNLEKEGKNINE